MKVWQTGELLSPYVFEPIRREELIQYAEASEDRNPIHLDESFAKEAGFPTVIAHGMLLMAFAGDYLCQKFSEADYRVSRFRSRFKKVTFPGDTLTAEGRIREVRPDGSLLVQVSLKNQRDEIPVESEAVIIPK